MSFGSIADGELRAPVSVQNQPSVLASEEDGHQNLEANKFLALVDP
uniref:Uncharacterized protein n=1 Tax=Arundo donax TaxID=35708 RepID=A0A0A9AS31_ARUDO